MDLLLVFFQGMRGLRQGDPMSPYLFTLVMEALTLIIKRKIKEYSDFTYHWKCKELEIVNLCFADDLLVFSNRDSKSVKILNDSLDEFSRCSGLLPNMSKSTMYLANVKPAATRKIMDMLPFKVGSL
jgi:hypothetical protein